MMFIVSKIIRPAREQPTGEELNYDDKSMRIIHIKWTASGNYRDDESKRLFLGIGSEAILHILILN